MYASKTMKGLFRPINPEKYKGDPSNVVYRSSWELSCMRMFDTSSNVIQWQSEERAILYRCPVRNSIHRYFPDFVIKVKSKNGSIKTYMIEVKPYAQTLPPKKTEKKKRKTLINEAKTYATNTAKWKAAQAFCKKRGWTFKILTEKEIYGLSI